MECWSGRSCKQSKHDGRPPQSAKRCDLAFELAARCSVCGRRRRVGVREGRFGRCCRCRLRLLPDGLGFHPLVRARRRTCRPEFRVHRVGVGQCWTVRVPDNVHLDRRWLEFRQRVGHCKSSVRRGHGHGARRLAARSERCLGIGARGCRFKLDLKRRRCRSEIVADRKGRHGRATAEAHPRKSNRDYPTHIDPCPPLRRTATFRP